jgi:hypothetical protein
LRKPKKKYETRKQEPDRPKKKTKKPKRQVIKDDLKRWDDVNWEKYSDE